MSTIYILLSIYTVCLFMAGYTCHAMFTAGRLEDAERWRALKEANVAYPNSTTVTWEGTE